MRLKKYITEEKDQSVIDMKVIEKFHDKVKSAKWREKTVLKRNDMIKGLHDLRQLREKIAKWYMKYKNKIGQKAVAIPGHVRSADQLMGYAQKSIKNYDIPNFAQQADRALMNLHYAISVGTGEKSAWR